MFASTVYDYRTNMRTQAAHCNIHVTCGFYMFLSTSARCSNYKDLASNHSISTSTNMLSQWTQNNTWACTTLLGQNVPLLKLYQSYYIIICYTNSGPSMLDKGQGAIRAGHLKNLRLWQLSCVQGPVFDWWHLMKKDAGMKKQRTNKTANCKSIRSTNPSQQVSVNIASSNGVSFYFLLPSPDIYLKTYRLTVTRHATDQTVHTKWHPCTARWIGCARPSFLCIQVKWPMAFRRSKQ